eukprot:IDg5752t1
MIFENASFLFRRTINAQKLVTILSSKLLACEYLSKAERCAAHRYDSAKKLLEKPVAGRRFTNRAPYYAPLVKCHEPVRYWL